MGMPKAALPFGDSSILERLIDTLTTGFAEIVVVAAPISDEPFSIDRVLQHRAGMQAELAAAVSVSGDAISESDDIVRSGALESLKHRTNFIIERDDAPFEGPVGALRRGLVRASSEVVFACSCDLPLLRSDLAIALCGMLNGQSDPIEATGHDATNPANSFEAAIPEIGGFPQPLCAAYRREPAIAALLAMEATNERRLTAIADRLKVNVISEVFLRDIDPDLRSFLNVNTAEDYARALRLVRAALTHAST
jgi:molybdopterin-guanine dinucleotide biosynthesis protein A